MVGIALKQSYSIINLPIQLYAKTFIEMLIQVSE